MMKLSYSQRDSLQKCGWAWHIERQEHKPGKPHWSTIGGSAFHNVVEAKILAAHGFADHIPTPAEALQGALDTELARGDGFWTEADVRASKSNVSKANPNGMDRTWIANNLPGWIASWEAWYRAVPWDIHLMDDGRPAVEVPFEMEIPGEIMVRGFVDAIFRNRQTGQFLVVDWKAGARTPASASQLGVYRVALEDQYGITADSGCYFMARKAVTTQMFDLSKFSMDRLVWEFNHTADRIEAKDFLPNYDTCNMCGVKDWCVFQDGKLSSEIALPWPTVSV